MTGADGACAHSESAGLDARAAEGDSVGGGKLRQCRLSCKSCEDILGGEPSGAESGGGANEEFAAMHRDLQYGLRPLALSSLPFRLHQLGGLRVHNFRLHPGKNLNHRGRRVSQGHHSNCLRKAASCWCISATSLLSSRISFSRWDRRSSFELRARSAAGEGARATSAADALPEKSCI